MLEVIKRTGAFLIIAETMYQFVQENRYARYVRLLIRLMTLALLILPICDLFREESSQAFYERLHDMENEFSVYMGEQNNTQELEEVMADADTRESVRTYALSQIRESCEACAQQSGYSIADVKIREKKLLFYLQKAGEGEPGVRIEPVTIQGTWNQEETSQNSISMEEKQTVGFLKKQFAQYLGIPEELIEVRMNEGMERQGK